MRRYRALAAVLVSALPIWMIACGDDSSDAPPATGGTSGDSGGGSGGKGGTDGGGTAGTGRGGTAGAATGGTGGDAGGDTGGSGGAGDGAGGTGGVPPEECDLSGAGLTRQALPTSIANDLELTNDRIWTINGHVFVRNGATLTIPACTRLEGSPAPNPGVLFAQKGGRIVAVGTANEPVLFTSAALPGARISGQWGGVVLLGSAPITATTETKQYEGLTGTDYEYGGTVDDDDSGTLQYVRIEFGGYEIASEKEINGLSMAGVGSGTTIDHVMVSNTLDDCFEWWGGSVETNFLVCNNPGDDMFDGDEGWVAGGEHWFGRRTGLVAVSSDDPNGFEWDGTPSGADLAPLPPTHIAATNVTLCGTGAAVSAARPNPELGMVLRERISGELDNLVLLGFEYGIDTRTVTGQTFMATDVTIDNSAFWAIMNTVGAPDVSDNDAGFVDDSIFTGGTNNELNPDPLPFTLEQCQASPPATAVRNSDVGAFAGDATWMNGLWVDWSED